MDIAGLRNGKPEVLLEVERLRDNPDANVLKVWMWLSNLRRRRKELPRIRFFQAFSDAYDREKSSGRDRAAFLAKKMHDEFRNVRYETLSFGLRPRSGARGIGGAAKREAKTMIKEMFAKLKKATKS